VLVVVNAQPMLFISRPLLYDRIRALVVPGGIREARSTLLELTQQTKVLASDSCVSCVEGF
jgi:hypothetical protein